ncbi:serine hydrolase (plasmid) [Haladaptatus sp. SPP-AMP-3]|uniref:serine hydrolase n=1 Tax=Haladaptatus sp. SPP-AMP-3 TaxID=3121295 RepID=UPI003C2D4A93
MATTKPTTIEVEQLEERARKLHTEQSCPGISVAVVDGTETVFADGFGKRQLDLEAPATQDTLYGIGSSTKPFTAMAVMMLVNDGKISLDDTVSSYVPYFEDAPGEPIRVRELLSHTSGMPSDDTATIILMGTILGNEFDDSLNGWEEFREYVDGSVERRRLDGNRCLYYNSGYIVLSRLIEVVSGTLFAEYVETNILEPLGMNRSTFDVDVLNSDTHDSMTPYYEKDDKMHGVNLPDDPLFEGPGGLQAPVTDLAKFIAAWNERDIPVDDDLATEMVEPVTVFRTLLDGTEIGYGYGWMTRPFGDDMLIGHSGGTGVSAGYLGFLKDRGIGIALGCNAQPNTSPERLAIELLAEITGTKPEKVLPKREIERKERRVTGEYTAYGEIQEATVSRTDEFLEIEYSSPLGAESMRLMPTSFDPHDYTFRVAKRSGKRTTVEFFVEDDGVELLINRNLYERVGELDE